MAARRVPAGLRRGADGVTRCAWCGDAPDYVAYHDREWGRPQDDDRRLFEKVCLEGFQSGLSWYTILRKRESFRAAFHGFDYARIARMGERDVLRLLQDPAIVRHRGKIEATIQNARAACALVGEGENLARFFWRFAPPGSARPRRATWAALRRLTETPASRALASELKRRGFVFVGPTTCYAFMQSVGLVNDHLEGCTVRPEVETARRRFRPPR